VNKLTRISWVGIASFLVPLLIFTLSVGTIWSNGIDASIVDMQYSMLKKGEFALGRISDLPLQTVDIGIFHGLAYSAIAPGFAFFSYPLIYILSKLAGISSVWDIMNADRFFVVFISSLLSYSIYKTIRLFTDERRALFLSFVSIFCTPVWPLSTVILPHTLSALLVSASLYFLIKSIRNKDAASSIFSGLFLGLASFTEYVATLYSIPMILLLVKNGLGKKRIILYGTSFSVGPLVNFIYNFFLFGNPLIFPEQLKVSSLGNGLTTAFNLSTAPFHMAYYITSPYRGILFLCPVLLFGFLYFNYRLTQIRSLYIFMLGIFLITLIFYSSWYDWAGGLFYGPRFLVIAVPFLILMQLQFLDSKHSRLIWSSYYFIVAYSLFIQAAGALTGAFSVYGNPFTFQPLEFNIPNLFSGKTDILWLNGASNAYQLAYSLSLIIPTMLLLLVISFRIFKEGQSPPIVSQAHHPTSSILVLQSGQSSV
jgi:4-amino-4-deoxy-L-arabinose transferase-like glycosyltransferase